MSFVHVALNMGYNKGGSMKLAIITITPRAQKLAEKIVDELADDPTVIRVDIFNKNVKQTLKNIFNSYDCIVGIMATGIMVRNICGLLKHKIKDPAVLVADETGEHVLSLVSGHLGGGNDFAVKIANLIGADPIITTSTDLNHKLGVDTLARRYLLSMDDPSKIKTINTALINNERVELGVTPDFDFLLENTEVKESYNGFISSSNEIEASYGNTELFLKPKKLVAGIGAKKGVSGETVIHAVEKAMKILGLPLRRLNWIATGEMKKNEPGIIDLSLKLRLPLEIISKDVLKNFKHPDCSKSDFVMQKFGIFGVCEPSAFIAAGQGSELIFKKTAFHGVTVALAVSKN